MLRLTCRMSSRLSDVCWCTVLKGILCVNTRLGCVQVLDVNSLWITHTNWPCHSHSQQWRRLRLGHRLTYRHGWALCSWPSMQTGHYWLIVPNKNHWYFTYIWKLHCLFFLILIFMLNAKHYSILSCLKQWVPVCWGFYPATCSPRGAADGYTSGANICEKLPDTDSPIPFPPFPFLLPLPPLPLSSSTLTFSSSPSPSLRSTPLKSS